MSANLKKNPSYGSNIRYKRETNRENAGKQMQFILSPLHKAINYDKSFAWFKNRLKRLKQHALKAQAPGASALSGHVKFLLLVVEMCENQ